MFTLLLACAGSPTDPEPFLFDPLQGLAAAPDVATDRLCTETGDEVFIDCVLEGATFGVSDLPVPATLTVVAWNLERGGHLDAQLAALTDGTVPAPDLLLISEADRGCSRTGIRNVAWELAEALEMNAVFGVEFVELPMDCEHGNVVASRFPLGNVGQTRHAENLSWYDSDQPRLGGRTAVYADVQLGDRYLHVEVVHFESNISALDIQEAQAAETAEHALASGLPSVVGGDTNAPYYTTDLYTGNTHDDTVGAFLDRGFADAHVMLPVEERGTLQTLVIDLVLGEGVRFSAPGLCAEAGCGDLSDHRAVWATVSLD